MSSNDKDDKCLVCLKIRTGGNFNIFSTYNISDGKEELYVDVIRNCFNIEITKDSGLHEMCSHCSLKLRHAYRFRQSIIDAVNTLVLAKVSETDVDYLEHIPFENNYQDDKPDQLSDLDKMSDTEDFCIFGFENNREGKDESKNVQVVNVREDNGQTDLLNANDGGVTDCLDNLEDGAKTDSLLNLDDGAKTDSLLNLDGGAKTDSLLNLDDGTKTDSLLSLEDETKSDSLLILDDSTLIPFNIEKDADHDEPYFVDLDNVDMFTCKNMPIDNDVMKENIDKDILNGHEEPYSLSILNENDLNTFLEEGEIRVLNISGNSFKKIARDDNGTKPETALSTEFSYMPFVFKHVTENNDFINVADATVTDVSNNVNKAKTKGFRKIIRKKVKKVGVENPVNDNLDKINENVNTAVENLSVEKESQTKAKKAVKRKAKSKTEQETTQKIVENKIDSSMGVENELLDKEAKGKKSKKGKKNVKKENKDADTVKENVPGEEVKPKKKRRKEPADDPVKRFLIMPGQTVCTVCNAEFETTIQLSQHVSTHPPEYVCPNCGLKFERKLKYNIHMRSHTKGPFYCKFCNQEFSNINTRNTHEWRVHSKPEPFKCAHCGERFKTYLKRLRHLQAVHQDNTQFPCQFCGKTFAYAAYRSKHIEIMHLNKRDYKCEKCPAAFARRGGLDNHMACKHGIGEMKYQCHLCKRKFFVQTALKWHVANIHNRHSCAECGEKFETPAALDQHSRMHDKSDLDISLGIDFSTLPLDEYGIMDSSYLDLNELEV